MIVTSIQISGWEGLVWPQMESMALQKAEKAPGKSSGQKSQQGGLCAVRNNVLFNAVVDSMLGLILL